MKPLLFALLITLSFVGSTSTVHATTTASSTSSVSSQNPQNFVPLLPSLPGLQDVQTQASLATFLSTLYKLCIGAAAVLAVLQLMRAGVMYMGGDSVTEKKDARNLITLSIVGLILVLAPYIVFSIINPAILRIDINARDLQTEIQVIQNSQNTSDAYTGNTPEAAAARICQTSPQKQAVTLATNQTCAQRLGPTYAEIPAQCCSGMAAGATCCAVDSVNAANAAQQAVAAQNAGTGTFNYTVSTRDINYDTGADCRLDSTSRNFPTLAACTADMNVNSSRSGYALNRACDSSYPHTPAAAWNAVKDLPMCN